MSEPHRTDPDPRVPRMAVAELRFDAGLVASLSDEEIERRLVDAPGDGILLVWSCDGAGAVAHGDALRGLYRVLGAAARARRVTFPARWIPVHSSAAHATVDSPQDARLLAIARGDAALQRLFTEAAPVLEGRGLARPDEPVVLLGAEGDALSTAVPTDAGSQPTELRRRAETWIQRLGADRVAFVVPASAGDAHPLVGVAARRALPVLAVGPAAGVPWHRSGDAAAAAPLLWTDFQFDQEHRLPDDSQVAGLRDLLHRGALLRERTLFERLPEAWQRRVDAELRALYAWHVSPLLRRVAALLQTCGAVAGTDLAAPLPQLRSVTAYLLGLTDQRPLDEVLVVEDPVESARRLATALQGFDRRLHVRVPEVAWAHLHARLAAWSEGGLLAHFSTTTGGRVRSFCFSGQPLGLRAPLRRGADGISRVALGEEDRRVLGWFELTCEIEAALSPRAGALSPSTAQEREPVRLAEILGIPAPAPVQLQFGFDATVVVHDPFQEKIA
jgi:hypothetical protein